MVVLWNKRDSYTLDIDAAVIESEKGAARVTCKGEDGYQPQLGFVFEVGQVNEAIKTGLAPRH